MGAKIFKPKVSDTIEFIDNNLKGCFNGIKYTTETGEERLIPCWLKHYGERFYLMPKYRAYYNFGNGLKFVKTNNDMVEITSDMFIYKAVMEMNNAIQLKLIRSKANENNKEIERSLRKIDKEYTPMEFVKKIFEEYNLICDLDYSYTWASIRNMPETHHTGLTESKITAGRPKFYDLDGGKCWYHGGKVRRVKISNEFTKYTLAKCVGKSESEISD